MQPFRATLNKGFQLTYKNGWTVSIQWGPTNYSDRRDPNLDMHEPLRAPGGVWEAKTAEAWSWVGDFTHTDGEPRSNLTPQEVTDYMVEVEAR
jgi:hypothetical protein